MKEIKVTIDISSPEGRQIVEELKQFPDIVSFESDLSLLEDPIKIYEQKVHQEEILKKNISDEYLESELFWALVEKKREKFCMDNGLV
ncbi:MAG: hypothetical protein WCZ43_08300 [Proteiniphilum sp.]